MKSYSAARSGAYVFVRAHGLSNLKSAPVLDAFLRGEIEDGATDVVIDLSDCTGMDSTFMGTVVGYAQTMKERGGRLVVINPGESNMRLLETLGVTTVLPVLQASELRGIDLQLEPLEVGPAQSPHERMAMIKQAHENLVKLKDENQSRFQPFLQALQHDLDKRQQDEDAQERAEAEAEERAAADEAAGEDDEGDESKS